MKYHLQLVGSMNVDMAPSVMLHFDSGKYVFGVGEGLQRSCIQQKVKLARVSTLFLSRIGNDVVGGLPGFILSASEHAKPLRIVGPPNLNHYLSACKAFLYRPDFRLSTLELPPHAGAQAGGAPEPKVPGQSPIAPSAWPWMRTRDVVQDGVLRVRPLHLFPSIRETPSGPPTSSPSNRNPSDVVVAAGTEAEPVPEEHPSKRRKSMCAPVEAEADPDAESQAQEAAERRIIESMFPSTGAVHSTTIATTVPAGGISRPRGSIASPRHGSPSCSPGSAPAASPQPMHPLNEEYQDSAPQLSPMALPTSVRRDHVIAYLCQGPDVPGKFDRKRALELGVREGKDFGTLSRGTPVQTASGTTVSPEQVMGPSKPGALFLILDLPNPAYVRDLVQHEVWREWRRAQPSLGHAGGLAPEMMCIVHSLGPGVLECLEYQAWIASFSPRTKHIINGVEYNVPSITYTSSALLVSKLSQLDANLFPLYYEDGGRVPKPLPPIPGADMVRSQPLLCFQFEPKPLLYLPSPVTGKTGPSGSTRTMGEGDQASDAADTASSLSTISLDPLPEDEAESQQLAQLKGEIVTALASTTPPTPEPLDLTVIPLGTGSSAPGLYRNVSSTLCRFPSGAVLLDVGEGTLGQLARHHGPQGVDEVLASLKLVYISHMHADHHLGFFGVLRAWHRIRAPGQRLYVLAPHAFLPWMRRFGECEAFGLEHVVFLDNHEFMTGSDMPDRGRGPPPRVGERTLASRPDATPVPATAADSCTPMPGAERRPSPYLSADPSVVTAFLAHCGITYLQTVQVHHCAYAYALTFEVDGVRVSFSGDCRPSPSFVRIGQQSTLLIHEATMNDDLRQEALHKRHSTISEAIQVGVDMRAKYVLLTHFSQRYPKIASIPLPPARASTALEAGDGGATPSAAAGSAEDATRAPVIGVAFDLMRIPLRDFWKLPAFLGPIQALFQEQEQAEGGGGSGTHTPEP